MTYAVYIVECSDGTLYTGTAKNVTSRVATHNAGKGAKYTRTRLPVALRACWQYATRGEALKREYQIKQLSRSAKLQLIYGTTATTSQH